ncbi:MAG: hypothetical protein ACLP2X_25220 [Syntrophobacteraceae bacterium]
MRHKLLLRKELMGCAALHPSYGSLHGFRVSRRDMKSRKSALTDGPPPAWNCARLADEHKFARKLDFFL